MSDPGKPAELRAVGTPLAHSMRHEERTIASLLLSAAAFASSRLQCSSGGSVGDAGLVVVDSGDAGSGSGFQTTCSPAVDLTAAMMITPPISNVPVDCVPQATAGYLTTVDSDAALQALFSADAGADCAQLMLPQGVDYSSQRVVVAEATGTMTVYQEGTTTAILKANKQSETVAVQQVFLIVLPTALTGSVQLTSCSTTCIPGPIACPAN